MPAVRAWPQKFSGHRPHRGRSPSSNWALTARQSLASHQAAKPLPLTYVPRLCNATSAGSAQTTEIPLPEVSGSFTFFLSNLPSKPIESTNGSWWMLQIVSATNLKVSTRTWTGSVPPRGSGWVRQPCRDLLNAGAPTRYREVVLTRSTIIPEFETKPERTFTRLRDSCKDQEPSATT